MQKVMNSITCDYLVQLIGYDSKAMRSWNYRILIELHICKWVAN
jgi:hypothetical protein